MTDKIEVLPLSSFDDRLRLQVARAIYSDPILSRYAMGAVPQGADIISVYKDSKTNVYAVDTVDYSLRSGAVSVTLTTVASATNGETGENATIPDTISTVVGGFGNDTISAAGSVLNHTLKGGPGNDTLTGSVGSAMEKQLAGTRASGAGLSFGPVINHLAVELPPAKKS